MPQPPDQYTLYCLHNEMFRKHERGETNVGYIYAAIMSSLAYIEALNQCDPDMKLTSVAFQPTAGSELRKAREWLERKLARTLSQARRDDLLHIMAQGCKKHPAYRAKRMPQRRNGVQCADCLRVWQATIDHRHWPWDYEPSRQIVLDILQGNEHFHELKWNRRCEHGSTLTRKAEQLANELLERDQANSLRFRNMGKGGVS